MVFQRCPKLKRGIWALQLHISCPLKWGEHWRRIPAVIFQAAEDGGSAFKKRSKWGTRVSTTVHPLHGPDPFASVRFDPCGNHLSKIPAGFVPWESCKRRASRVNHSTSCGS